MARTAKASKDVQIEQGIIVFKFSNEKELILDMAKVPEQTRLQLAFHGGSQKVGDSYAGAEDADDAYESAQETIDQLYAGQWKVRSAGEPRTNQLIEAIVEISGLDVAAVKEKIETLDEDTVKALRANDEVKAKIAEIKLRKLNEKLAQAKTGEEAPVDLKQLFAAG